MIISISGLIGSGKDTIADYLVQHHEFLRESWANSLKSAVAAVFDWDRELLEGRTDEARVWREKVDTWWANRLNMPNLTPRWILQYWGTEVCRHGFHDEIWVASVENKLRNSKSNIVLSDSRFSNELNAIKRAGGITLRVVRGSDPDWVKLCKSNFDEFRKTYPNVHASEYSSVNLSYDYIIDNNGSLQDLFDKVNDLLLSHQFSK